MNAEVIPNGYEKKRNRKRKLVLARSNGRQIHMIIWKDAKVEERTKALKQLQARSKFMYSARIKNMTKENQPYG